MAEKQKRASFLLKTAEEIVAERHEDGPPAETIQSAMDRHGVRFDPEYKAKNRAKVLSEMEVNREYSPATALDLHVPQEHPYRYHWFNDVVRDKRGGLGPWVAMKADDIDEARQFCKSQRMKVSDDGRIKVGTLFLAKAPTSEVEQINALNYQRSQRNAKAAQAGAKTTVRTSLKDGTERQDGETFDSLHRASTSEADPTGVKLTSQLKDTAPI